MPTYVYACTECDHRFEAQQAFTDNALTECPNCGGKLRKVFNSVGIVFKGSGFYRTDSRGKGETSSTTSTSDTSPKDTSSKPSTGSDSGNSSSASGSGSTSTPSSSNSSGSSGSTSNSAPSKSSSTSAA